MTSSAPGPIVVDASVVLAISLQEPAFKRAESILREHSGAGGALLAPAILWLELVNVLVRRYRQPPALVLESIVDLETLGLESVDLDRPQLLLTIDAVARHGLSAYDAAYLALTESADAQLVTADRRLAAAAGARAVRLDGGREIRETDQPYTGSWATWPGAAAYLKELRARILSQANG